MAVIRFNDDIFTVDSQEYEILKNSAENIKGVDGAILEIGTRMGGSAKLIIDTLVENEDINRSMFCVDPFGNIELEITNINASIHYPGKFHVEGDLMSKDNSFKTKFDYTNDMRNYIIPSLTYYAYKAGLNFNFFCLEDSEFFKRYSDGVPVYENEKKIVNNYALIFLDGPHTNEAVKEELDFFIPRSQKGTIIIGDDIWMYDHDKYFETPLLHHGFKIFEKGKIKAAYVKE